LQRAIQIMKRHRDIHFDGTGASKYRPISMIITTLAAQLYKGELDVYTALKNIIEGLYAYSSLLQGQSVTDQALTGPKLIQRNSDGTWYIPNPINREENFADKWHKDSNARAIAFFYWVSKLKEEIIDVLKSYDRKRVRAALVAGLGAPFVNKQFDSMWPLVNPKPNTSTTQINITQGQKPWSTGSAK